MMEGRQMKYVKPKAKPQPPAASGPKPAAPAEAQSKPAAAHGQPRFSLFQQASAPPSPEAPTQGL